MSSKNFVPRWKKLRIPKFKPFLASENIIKSTVDISYIFSYHAHCAQIHTWKIPYKRVKTRSPVILNIIGYSIFVAGNEISQRIEFLNYMCIILTRYNVRQYTRVCKYIIYISIFVAGNEISQNIEFLNYTCIILTHYDNIHTYTYTHLHIYIHIYVNILCTFIITNKNVYTFSQ